MDTITITIYIINLQFCVCKVLLEGSMSHIFGLGPTFHFMAKNR